MIKKKILIALIVFCSFLFLYFFFLRKDEHPINLINLDVYIHEKLIRLDSVYTHIPRKNDSDTDLISYQTFEELKDLIKSNEQSTDSSLNVDSNNSLRFEPPDDSTYRFIWYEPNEKNNCTIREFASWRTSRKYFDHWTNLYDGRCHDYPTIYAARRMNTKQQTELHRWIKSINLRVSSERKSIFFYYEERILSRFSFLPWTQVR